MYELKRSEKIEEEIKIGDDIIKVSLEVDDITKDFNKRYNAIIRAEQEINTLKNDGTPEAMESASIAYGTAIIELLKLVFGEENTTKILEFYQNRNFEMAEQVFPFIIDVIYPKIQKSIQDKRKKLTEQYHANKTLRRKMGL